MRVPLYAPVLALGVLGAGPVMAAASTAAPATPSLTLYEKADFAGRHVTFHGPAENARQAFDAKSARSTGVWTLCEGREPASGCQTVTGPVAKLKIAPAIVRPGVDAVALYEEPGLKGRRVVYSFASDQPPPFRTRSARTWGGAMAICSRAGGRPGLTCPILISTASGRSPSITWQCPPASQSDHAPPQVRALRVRNGGGWSEAKE